VPFQVVPEGRIDYRHRLHLAALGEDRQTALGMVEVTELHAAEGALADPDLEQQVKRDPIAPVVAREDPLLLIRREGCVLPRFFGGPIGRAGSP
jgi:hypothetical protein